MEDRTIIYEQPIPIVQVIDLPADNKQETEDSPSDSKTYNWIAHMQLSNGLVESAEFTDFVSLYDNALAAMIFLSEGDVELAEKIFDYFENNLESEFFQNDGGFFQYRDTSGFNGSRIWMGDNAWLLIALNNYHEITNSQKYQGMATELELWLRSLQDEDGGLRGGVNEDGTIIPRVTEGIITAFNAVKGFDEFHENILRFLHEQRWDWNEEILITDTNNPDYNYALDLYSLGYMIFENYPTEVLSKANRFINSQTSTTNGKTINGYCFDDDKDVVWLEGTAQMALAFEVAGLTQDSENILLNLQESFIKSSMAENASGIPYTTNYGTDFGASYLWDHSDIAPAISSSAWYLFVKNKFNPFGLEHFKGIPEESKFWIHGAVN